MAGNKTRLVTVAVTRVTDVNQPNDCVPPKPLKQKITKENNHLSIKKSYDCRFE